MRTILPYIVTLCLILIAGPSHGQQLINPQTDTIQWEYSKIENKLLSENVTMGGKFISYGGKSFRWIQNGVDREYSFANQSAKGSWSDITQDGELIYQSECKEVDGTIRVYREKRKIFLVLDFVQPDKRTPHFVFEISSYSKL